MEFFQIIKRNYKIITKIFLTAQTVLFQQLKNNRTFLLVFIAFLDYSNYYLKGDFYGS
jgi:hypothetical protein